MNLLKKTSLLLCSSVIYPVWADTEIIPVMGLKAGYQWAQDDDYHHTPNSSIWGGFVGLRLHEWGVDFGYQYHDTLEAPATQIQIQTQLIEIALSYEWAYNSTWSLYGRAGAAFWEIDKTSPIKTFYQEQGVSPLLELGMTYALTPQMRLSSGYQFIHGLGNSRIGEYDSHALMIGMTYQWGDSNSSPEPLPITLRPVEENAEKIVTPVLAEPSEYHIGFDFDSAHLTYDAIKVIDSLAQEMLENSLLRADIVGHTDNTGSDAYNQVLSERRAFEVKKALMSHGISNERIQISAAGEAQPITENKTENGRKKNRRATVLVTSTQIEPN